MNVHCNPYAGTMYMKQNHNSKNYNHLKNSPYEESKNKQWMNILLTKKSTIGYLIK